MPLDPTKIAAIIKRRKLTHTALADKMGMAQPNLVRMVSGRRPDPNLSTAERLAKALGCKVTDLISDAIETADHSAKS